MNKDEFNHVEEAPDLSPEDEEIFNNLYTNIDSLEDLFDDGEESPDESIEARSNREVPLDG